MSDPYAQGVPQQQATGGGAAPGWYPDPSGRLRWWDGAQWGPYQDGGAPGMAPAPMGMGMGGGPTDPQARSQAALAHWLGLLGWIGPLIIYVTSGDKDPFVKHNAAEALNFHLTMLIAYFVSIPLMFVLIGLLTLPAVFIASIVFSIIGAGAANRGEYYKYPFTIRMVSGGLVQ